MSPLVSPRRSRTRPHRPALRLLRGAAPQETAPVLLAGTNAWLRTELRATLPPRTVLAEASNVAEVLEHARSSRMVILAGNLDDADAASLVHLLGQRHPQLPVVCIDEPMPAVAAGHA